ncbi:MAG: beta-N-acetylhexosaminidase [Alphaproteobacteria bacterium]
MYDACMSVESSSAVILSLSGSTLSEAERAFFKQANPLGFILFARNCETPDQVRALTDSLRETVGRECPILIDQEGGRVQRLKPPHWRQYPPMKLFGDQIEDEGEAQALDSLRFTIMQIAEELKDCGVSVDCAPVLDVLFPETHDVIGDRAFSSDPAIVARLGLSVCRNFLAAGVTPVIKHLPGHGRATADSHKDLPVVTTALEDLEQTDFLPFRTVAADPCARGVWGMMAHVVYSAIDPALPASVSPRVIADTIRGSIGFDGFLLGDDLDMEALSGLGPIEARVQATLEAGCDAALYCAGKLPVMEKIAESVPKLSEKARRRLQNAAEFTKIAA